MERHEGSLDPDPAEISPLCAECQTFLTSPGHTRAAPGDPEYTKFHPEGASWWLVSDRISRSPDAIIKSADNGCHLCSLVAGELLHPVRLAYRGGVDKIQEKGSIFLAFQRSKHDTELKLQVCYAPPEGTMDKDKYKFTGVATHAVDNGFFILNLYAILPYEVARSALRHVDLPTSTNTGSKSSLSVAKRWIEECIKEHPRCCQQMTERTFPSRVIDLGDGHSIKPKLLETSDLSAEQAYGVLSYCWGPPDIQQLKLTLSNYDTLQKGIDPRSLPLTLRDAMNACHGLGVRYLWIDACCIIQDSPQDWNREAAKMAKVYENALFCISASAAADSSQGCFRGRDPLSSFTKPCLMKICLDAEDSGTPGALGDDCEDLVEEVTEMNLGNLDDCGSNSKKHEADASRILNINNYYYCVPYQQWSRDIEDAFLASRGWVVQERFLSPRLIYFGRRQLVWECREKRASECLENGVILPQTDWEQLYTNGNGNQNTNDLNRVMLQMLGVTWPWNPSNLRNQFTASEELWHNIISLYSKRNLTFMSDKLAAVQGIASCLQETTKDEYLAGLWRKNLPMDLMWRSEAGNVRSCEYRAPSWSWASTNHHIKWWGLAFPYDQVRQPMLTVEDASMTYDGSGTLRSGSLCCAGRLYKGIWRAQEIMIGNFKCWAERDAPEAFQTDHTCGYKTDRATSILPPPFQEVYCAPLYQHYYSGVDGAISGLLLIPTGRLGEYRRFGWFLSEDHKRPEHEQFFFPRRKPRWPPKNLEEIQNLDYELQKWLSLSGTERELTSEALNQPPCQQSLFIPRALSLAERTEFFQRAKMGEDRLLRVGSEVQEYLSRDAHGSHCYKYTII